MIPALTVAILSGELSESRLSRIELTPTGSVAHGVARLPAHLNPATTHCPPPSPGRAAPLARRRPRSPSRAAPDNRGGRSPARRLTWLLVSCCAGLCISWAGFWCQSLITATAYSVVGVMNKMLTVFVNVLIWDKHASALGIGSLAICIAGGSLYQQAPLREPAVAPEAVALKADESSPYDSNGDSSGDLEARGEGRETHPSPSRGPKFGFFARAGLAAMNFSRNACT